MLHKTKPCIITWSKTSINFKFKRLCFEHKDACLNHTRKQLMEYTLLFTADDTNAITLCMKATMLKSTSDGSQQVTVMHWAMQQYASKMRGRINPPEKSVELNSAGIKNGLCKFLIRKEKAPNVFVGAEGCFSERREQENRTLSL